jgi:hypothetical protein
MLLQNQQNSGGRKHQLGWHDTCNMSTRHSKSNSVWVPLKRSPQGGMS